MEFNTSLLILSPERIITVLLIFNPLYITLLSRHSTSEGLFLLIVTLLLAVIEILYAYAIIRLIQRIRSLQQIKE